MDIIEWIEEFSDGYIWFAKRLSGNDTLANGSHQAGPYIPKNVFFRLFPSLADRRKENPDTYFEMVIDSHPDIRKVRIVWYNNKFRGGTRDEVRITNLGGANSPLLDPESTGALVVFAFKKERSNDAKICHVWICRNEIEEDLIELETGPVEPGRGRIVWPPEYNFITSLVRAVRANCRLANNEIPQEWLEQFPSGNDIIKKVIQMRPEFRQIAVDSRILKRRKCEFELFLSLEEAIELPRIRNGFATIAEFLEAAQTILQRRKSRSGRSLELHMREILIEENFQEGKDFSYQPKVGGRPDFLFPNEKAYLNQNFPRENIKMLAVKTTFKDRWRQVTRECPDLQTRYLLTLQEGVSEDQFRLITEAGIRLVVPEPIISKYKNTIRPDILTLEAFLAEVRLVQI